jgi:1-acyl-sn-glycerol-3-phosphate acyltransferase
VEVLDPIAPGLDKEAFFERLQREVETAAARLLAEGERNGARDPSRPSVQGRDV